MQKILSREVLAAVNYDLNTPFFSIKKLYEHLRDAKAKVPWRKLICNNTASP